MPRFVIGLVAFPSKDKATADIRRILHTAELGQELTGRDGGLIAALYAMHPRRNGTPVAFSVRLHSFHGTQTRGFYALTEGEWQPFSYRPCLSPATDDPSLLMAMRAAISLSQREALRNAYHGRAFLPCYKDKTHLVPLAEAHVHHLPPKFRDIADAFVGLVGLPEIIHSPVLGDDFADARLRRRWILFHDAVAHRVVVCAKCNAADERE